MNALLVLTVVATASAGPQVLLGGYAGYAGYPLSYGSPLAYSYTPQVTKLVAKEVEIPVNTIEYSVKDTGCKNVFGFNVPCLAEGEARRKRQAEEDTVEVVAEAAPEAVEEAVEEAEATPAAPALTYTAGLPFSYGYGLPYAGLGYAGLGYAGLGYAGLPYASVLPSVKVNEPVVTEVEVPHYVYKQVVQKVDLQPLCHNGLGFAVPCA